MMFEVEINNKLLYGNYFAIDEVERLWQCMAEEADYIELNVIEGSRAYWEDCDGENIHEFLENAEKCGFIDCYEIIRVK